MNMKRKVFFPRQAAFLLLAFAVFCPRVSGVDLEELVGAGRAAALLAGERQVLAQFKNPRARLLPHNEFARSLVESLYSELEPSTLVETLHLYKKPPEAARPAWSAAEEAGIYNRMLALSSLAGLQYYSASRGAMRTFYASSSVIDGPDAKNPLPDPVFSAPQKALTIYARQKDLTFGDNIYQYDYYSAPSGLFFIQRNLTMLTAGIIPAVGKEKFRSAVAVLDAGSYLLVYAALMAKAVSLPGMNERVSNSFTNRAEAVINWFSAQADKAFGEARE